MNARIAWDRGHEPFFPFLSFFLLYFSLYFSRFFHIFFRFFRFFLEFFVFKNTKNRKSIGQHVWSTINRSTRVDKSNMRILDLSRGDARIFSCPKQCHLEAGWTCGSWVRFESTHRSFSPKWRHLVRAIKGPFQKKNKQFSFFFLSLLYQILSLSSYFSQLQSKSRKPRFRCWCRLASRRAPPCQLPFTMVEKIKISRFPTKFPD